MSDPINVGQNAMTVRKSVAMTPYSKVVINVDAETSYVAGNDSGSVLEFDNPWGTQTMANNILKKINGLQYQPYTVTGGLIDPAAELGDAVTTNGVYGGLYTQDSFYGHQFYADYSAPQDEQLDHEFTYESPTERRITRQEAWTKSEFTITNNAISAEVTARTEGDSQLQSQLNVQAGEISAKVSQTGGSASTFGWYLKSDKFELKSGNKAVFTCNSSGITVDGAIKARSGYIGTDSSGFVISSKYIAKGKTAYNDTNSGVYLGTDGIGLGANKFTVSSSGVLTAKDATLTGTVTAKEGRIGADSNGENGFIIKANKMYNGTSSISNTTAGFYIGTDGLRIYKDVKNSVTLKADGTISIMKGMTGVDDEANTSGLFIGDAGIALGGGKFKVTKAGALTAKSATITGAVTATSGKIGSDSSGYFVIGAKSIYNGTTSLASTVAGVYIGTDGLRIYKDSTNSVTLKADGTVSIMKGMTKIDDTANTSGLFIGDTGIALGGGKFSVTKAGALVAKNATLTGSITATSGKIGSDTSGYFTIGSKSIYNGKTAYNSSAEGVYIGTDGIGLGSKAFYVTKTGKLVATDVEVTGYVKATSGSFAGELKAATGSFKGELSAATGSFKGELTAATGTFKGELSAATGSFKGELKAATGTFKGELTAATGDFTGEIKATSGYIGDGTNGFTIKSTYIHNGKSSIDNTTNANGVYIGTNGIGIGRVGSGTTSKPYSTAFKVTSDGKLIAQNVDIKGYVKATDGEFAGELKSATGKFAGELTAATGDFRGELKAATGDFSGTITAKSGYIGTSSSGFTITSKGIHKGTDSLTSTTAGVYLCADGLRIYKDATRSVTLKADGTVSIMKGMIAVTDTTNTTGMFIGDAGIALGGGKFKVTNKGALTATSATITGSITATGGKIGSDATGYFTIGAKSIYHGTNSVTSTKEGVFVGTEGIRIYKDATHSATIKADGTITLMGGMKAIDDTANTSGFFLGSTGIVLGGGKFKVTKAGVLTATSATIKGAITATSGKIGSDESSYFTIGSKSIYNGKSSLDNYTNAKGIYIGTDGISLGRAGSGTSSDPYRSTFKVTSAGALYAESGEFWGEVHTGAGSSVNGTYIKDGTVGETQLGDDAVTETKLGSSSVTSNKISSGAVTTAKVSETVKNSLEAGDYAKAKFDSLVAGSIKATYLKATYTEGDTVQAGSLTVKRNSSNLIASWKSTTISGTTIYYLGRDSF